MALIFETKNFIVESFETPHVTRTDGGNIRIKIKDESITDRTKLSPTQATEAMRLTMVVGEALEIAMNKRGIPIVKVNYYDMGNWAYKTGKKPFFHYHIYGRAKNAVKQPFPEAVYLPDRSTSFYDNFEPLNSGDVQAIREEILKLFAQEKYQDHNWRL
jgi:diadenosine tetraphosphate (Ap4A) HIT family hydrolase